MKKILAIFMLAFSVFSLADATVNPVDTTKLNAVSKDKLDDGLNKLNDDELKFLKGNSNRKEINGKTYIKFKKNHNITSAIEIDGGSIKGLNLTDQGESLSKYDILTGYGIRYFNSEINKAVKSGKKVLNTDGKYVRLFEDVVVNLERSVVVFDGDNILFVFPNYELGPKESGMPVFSFNIKSVNKYLKYIK